MLLERERCNDDDDFLVALWHNYIQTSGLEQSRKNHSFSSLTCVLLIAIFKVNNSTLFFGGKWLDKKPGICTFGTFDYTDVIRLLVSHVMMRNMNRATLLLRKRVKIKESNLQSVSYFRLWFVFFCKIWFITL